MSGLGPRVPRRRWRRALSLLVVVAIVGACGGSGGSDSAATTTVVGASAGKARAASLPFVSPARYTGPQGRVGQFVVTCDYSHSAFDDPIVHRGHHGRSHRHDFYGADSTDQNSTAESLADDPTTCNKSVDTAAYWQPTLYDHDEVVVPEHISAYYRAAPGVDPVEVEPMPFGLALIAGDATATRPQRGDATGWTCGSSSKLSDDPPTCTSSAPLHLVLTFDDCWDGVHLEADDFRSHATSSTDGRCPETHPVHIPQLTVSVKFPVYGEGHSLKLASGNIYSAHGDFYNAWDPAGLRREVEGCIHRGAVCDLASNREEEPLFSG